VSTRLAVGAVAACLLLGGGAPDARLSLAVLLAAAALVGAGWLAGTALARRRAGLTLAAAGAGAMVIAIRLMLAPPLVPPTDIALPEGEGPWRAAVISVGPLREGDRPAMLELEEPAGVRIAATLPAWPAVVPGDRVSVDGSFEPRPDGEYGAYLLEVGAAGILRARAVAVEPPSGDFGRGLEGLRRGADEALRVAIPEPEAGLAAGILIGLRDRVDRTLAADFTTVGATHVVAISGWNIAIVASTLGAVAGRVARRRRAALTALAIVVYVVFVGASPSVVRAAAMAGVVLLARELGRPSRAAAAIGWAVTLLLLVDPALIDDVGFRLSALATAGLIAWGTPFAARLAGPAPGRLRAWLAESLGVSMAAQLATLPIVALEFGRLSLVSPIVNLGVVPLVAPAMAAGTVALVAGALVMAGVPAVIGSLLGLPAWTLLAGIVGLVRAGAAVPYASLALAAPWDAAVAALAGGAIVLVDRRLRRARRGSGAGVSAGARASVGGSAAGHGSAATPKGHPTGSPPAPGKTRPAGLRAPRGRSERVLATSLAAATVALAIAIAHRPDGIARLTFLDVGQGDAVLLEGERGTRLLVDGGPDPGKLLVALDERLPPWDRRIDVLVLTHPHEDHAAGLAALIGRYGVRRVLEPGMIGPGPGYAALQAVLVASGVERGGLATGDRLGVDGVRLDVLWPDPGDVPETPPDGGTGINNVSIVLLGEVGRHRFLLTGDIEEEIDPTLLQRGLPEVDILKVAHHGSRTSSTEPLLAALRPSVAIVSSGRGNPYGHPAPATVERIEAAGIQLLRTDTDGTVEIELGPGLARVRTSRAVPLDGRLAAAAPRLPSATGLGFVPATQPGSPPAPGTAFVCGLPVAGAATLFDRPPDPGELAGGGGSAVLEPPGASAAKAADHPILVIGRPPPLGPAPTLRYHPSGDLPLAGSPGVAIESSSRRLLLGRRRLRHRGGRGGAPPRSGPLPRRDARSLAGPGRGRRCGPHHRGPPRAPLHGHDVRLRDPGHPLERRPARATRRRP
jgi:competence protein ComEC